MEYNVVHHCGDGNIVSDDSGGHIMRYNICYLADHRHTAGNGYGLKTKPSNSTGAPADWVHHNVVFLSDSSGIIINTYAGTDGAFVYNNLSYGNAQKGITSTDLTDEIIKNNVSFNNGGNDINYSGSEPDTIDYNFHGDGNYGAASPHSLSGDPQCNNIALLSVDNNGDGTPDVLDVLNDASNFANTEAALQYAFGQINEIFKLKAGSPCIDAGINLGLGFADLMGNDPVDDPSTADPWPDDSDPGLVDMGAIEYVP
jgi:hypothetical protein